MQDQGTAPKSNLPSGPSPDSSQNPDSSENTSQPQAPSKAYEEATNSLVYRLSELMFGSLLASYVLGFIQFFGGHARSLVEHFTRGELVVSLPYLFISFTFAYLTAGFYLSYNAGILTMPHMTLKHLRSDFLLALWQAIAFGVSMLFPPTTPILLGTALSGALLRQRREQKELTQSFFSACVRKPASSHWKQDENLEQYQEFRSTFNEYLNKNLDNKKRKYPNLSGWKKVQLHSITVVIGLFALGAGTWFAAGKFKDWAGWIFLGESILIAGATFGYVHGILGDRAKFMNKLPKMDDEFFKLIDELKKHYANSNS